MDALEFLRERKRMCKSFGNSCDGCPLHGGPCTSLSTMNDGDCERILVKVEQWSKEHPCKTRQSVFLEQWPGAEIKDGSLRICPKRISADCRSRYGDCANRTCSDCYREFWMQEVE